MNGPRDGKTSRWSPAVFLWIPPLCLSLGVLLLHFTGCAGSSDSVTTQSDSAATQETQPKAQQHKAPRQGKSIQSQSSSDSPRQLQQDRKNVIAEVPEADSEQKSKAKKKKPARKSQPSGETVLPPEPSKPPAIGGSGG
jgi:hypothetical protein